LKKLIAGLVIGMLIGSFGVAFAAESPTVQAMFEKFSLQINGDKATEIIPLTYEGTTYLPVREAAGLLGYEVDYDKETKTIKLDQSQKEKDVSNVNDVVINLDEWVPLRDLSTKNGVQVMVHPDKNNQMVISKGNTEINFILPVNKEENEYTVSNGTQVILFKDGAAYMKKTDAEALGFAGQ